MLANVPRPHSPPRVTIRGVFILNVSHAFMEKRVSFLIDGFNLYHSISQSAQGNEFRKCKWLDLGQLCHSTLHIINPDATLARIHYFTAIPHHLEKTNPDKLTRHRLYLRALTTQRDPAITIHEGRIRQQEIFVESNVSKNYIKHWREKGTDVALAVHLIYEAQLNVADEFVIISGDSDYVPLIQYFKLMFPDKNIRFAFPAGRPSSEIQKLAPLSFKLGADTYRSCQFPEVIKLPSGKKIYRPIEWS
jgi:uncharacterized LabA/DUF88 family protein